MSTLRGREGRDGSERDRGRDSDKNEEGKCLLIDESSTTWFFIADIGDTRMKFIYNDFLRLTRELLSKRTLRVTMIWGLRKEIVKLKIEEMNVKVVVNSPRTSKD